MPAQLVANILVAAGWISLVGVSFGLIFSCTRFFHFAHGVVFTAAAYFTFAFASWASLPLFLSVPLSIVLTILLGCLVEIAIYRPLRHKGSSSLVLLLASLGVYILLQNTISMVFGDSTKTLRTGRIEEGFGVFGAKITAIQMTTILSAVVLLVGLKILLSTTRLGRALRAVANDPELANISGIDSNRVILWAFAFGSGFVGTAGILVALDVGMTPTMGMTPLMIGIVAVIVGGTNSMPGIVLAALLLAAAQRLGAWAISSQWQDTIAFVILLAFLLLRPEGFFGKRIKNAAV